MAARQQQPAGHTVGRHRRRGARPRGQRRSRSRQGRQDRPPPPPRRLAAPSGPSGNVCPVDDFAQPLVVSIAVSPGDVPRQAALAFACVVSSISRVASAGGIGGQLGLGYIAHAPSVAAGYVTGGLTMLLALPSLLLLRRMREQADLIVGRKPGTRGPCAGQGSQRCRRSTPRPASRRPRLDHPPPAGPGGESRSARISIAEPCRPGHRPPGSGRCR